MGWRYGGLLVALQVIFLCSLHRAAASAGGEGLPSILSPIVDGLCNTVTCGKGSCRVSPEHAFGYVCDCEPGWTKLHFGDHFQFLPCIIPNCTFDNSCYNSSTAPAPEVGPPPPSNRSLFDPCSWSHCGEGTCVRTSTFGHRCNCNPGYENLLNATVFPCFKECAFGADCAGLGIDVPIRSPASSTSAPPSSGTAPNRGEEIGSPLPSPPSSGSAPNRGETIGSPPPSSSPSSGSAPNRGEKIGPPPSSSPPSSGRAPNGAAVRFSWSLIRIFLLIVPLAMIPRA